MVYIKHIPNIVKPLAKQLIFNIPNDANEIYLTFDDGPHPEITPWVLNQLDQYAAKGTFFLTGKNAAAFPHLVEEITGRGHRIGNHSQNHLSGWKSKNAEYYADVAACTEHVESNLFRPPYGQISFEQANHLRPDYKIIMWSDLSADFDQKLDATQVLHHATHKVECGSIIVFHDSEKAWPRLEHALPKCLAYYAKQNFNMSNISI